MVEPVVLNHQVQNAVEERHVTARFDGQKQITGAGDRRETWIDHDDLGAMLARLPDVIRGDGRALGDVGPTDPDNLGLENVAPRIGGAVDAERFLVRRPGADPAQTAVVVDVRCLETEAGNLPVR